MPYHVLVCKTCDRITSDPEHGPEDDYCTSPDGFERIYLWTQQEIARRLGNEAAEVFR